MKRIHSILVVTALLSLGFAAGCEQKPTASNATQAIEQSKAAGPTVQSQVDYLAGQAKAFVSSKNYDQAVQVANYILSNLDQNSQAAKDILEKAKAEMQKMAQGAVDDMKNKLGTLGK